MTTMAVEGDETRINCVTGKRLVGTVGQNLVVVLVVVLVEQSRAK